MARLAALVPKPRVDLTRFHITHCRTYPKPPMNARCERFSRTASFVDCHEGLCCSPMSLLATENSPTGRCCATSHDPLVLRSPVQSSLINHAACHIAEEANQKLMRAKIPGGE